MSLFEIPEWRRRLLKPQVLQRAANWCYRAKRKLRHEDFSNELTKDLAQDLRRMLSKAALPVQFVDINEACLDPSRFHDLLVEVAQEVRAADQLDRREPWPRWGNEMYAQT